MRTLFLSLLLFAGAVALFADAKQPGAVASDDEKEILRLEKVINEAWLKHDVATISQIVADDFESWSFKGQRRGRADLLQARREQQGNQNRSGRREGSCFR